MTLLIASAAADCGNSETAAHRRGPLLRVCAFAGLLLAALSADRALAADWIDDTFLRGSVTAKGPMRWDGVTLGGQLGMSNMNTDFSNVSSSALQSMFHDSTLQNENPPSSWPVLSGNTTSSRSYGGFLGYNMQWDQLVLGFDITYNRMSGMNASSGPTNLHRVTATSDGTVHDVNINAQAAIQLNDYASYRVRGGYAIGQFLPYAFFGGVVGRFNYSSLVSATDTQTAGGVTAPPYAPTPISTNRTGAIVGGATVGLGIDIALLPNVFVRGEWEFIAWGQVNGIRPTMNTAHVALGLKF